jgi:hypothetical protein
MGIRDTITKKKKANTIQKLHKHWLEEDAAFTEGFSDSSSIAVQDKPDDQALDEYNFPQKQSINIKDFNSIDPDDDNVSFDIPVRYVFQGIFVVSLLLVMLSVMLTILISNSCS